MNETQQTPESLHWWLSHHQKEPNCWKWIRVQEENFLGLLQALGPLSNDAGLATTCFWGACPPFFTVPSFTFKLTLQVVLLRSFGQSLMRWSGLPHLKQFWFFFWYSLTALTKWTIWPTCWFAPPIPLNISGSSSSEDSASSSPSGFTLKYSSASMLSTVVDLAVKIQLPFSFLEGNEFPDVCGWVTFKPPIVVVLGSRGSLASVCFSNFRAARSRLE